MAEVSLFPGALDDTNLYEVVARLSTTLTADITAATTTIPLASTTGFPTKGNIVIDNETIAYISVSVGSVDATGGRGKAGTAASHLSTTQVLVAVTATDFNKLRAGLIAVQTALKVNLTSTVLTTPIINSSITGTAIATGYEVTVGSDNTKIVTPKAIGDAGLNTRLNSKIITGTRDMAAVSGAASYTGTGFTPTSVQVFAIINGTLFTSQGFVDSAGAGACVMVIDATQSSYTDSVIYINTATGAHQVANLRSFDANGISLDWIQTGSPTGTVDLRFLCFR